MASISAPPSAVSDHLEYGLRSTAVRASFLLHFLVQQSVSYSMHTYYVSKACRKIALHEIDRPVAGLFS